ncbi:Zinc finger MYND domain-containing protein 15 [Heracleum sosnowskyi]|uniref:Zinc finger MYND domain-containing protein 15 n=1 Tax=Heracleum sosnowskyi TaxID=360622 RepID=A0AAD8HLG3_9APIA|nr:Zinc finger MYND domain-containing protein 15 [Heracleum sosnowskyi]
MDVHLKNLFSRFQEQFGSGPGLGPGSGTCLMNVDGVTPLAIKSLYRAAAALYRTNAWKRLRPGHFFGVRVGKDSDWSCKKQPFPCLQFIGGDGGDLGFYMFRSESEAVKMTGLRETIRVPNVEVFRVTYMEGDLLLPSHRRMIKSLVLEVSGDGRFPVFDVARCTSTGELQFRNPSFEELKYIFIIMKAISLVHPLLQQETDSGPKWSRLIYFEPFIETVDIQLPPGIVEGNNDLVAVTVSHPPGQGYDERTSSTANSTPTKSLEPEKEETFEDVKENVTDIFRQCAVCNKDVRGEELVCCASCRAVVYCGTPCLELHWEETHRNMCGLYKAVMEREEELEMKIFVFPCSVEQPCKWLELLGIHLKGMWRRKCNCYSHCSYGLLPADDGISYSWGGLNEDEYPHDSPFESRSRDGMSSPILYRWSDYYSLRSLPLSSPVADILSHPFTVYHILTAVDTNSKNLLLHGKEVTVHYVGPEAELDWIPAFTEISHVLNEMGNINLVMVGPGVPTNLSGTTIGIGSRIRVNLVRGLYQEESMYLPTPHVFVALNCRLESYSSWGGALELIKSMGIPAYFTDQTEILCLNARQVLHSSGLHVTHSVTPNPFRSPVRNHRPSDNLPSYSNAFLFGVNT